MLIAICGRQPALSLAELESLFGAQKIQPVGDYAALLDVEPAEAKLSRLGGTVKLAKLLAEIPTRSWAGVESYLLKTAPAHLEYLPEGKLRLGLNAYGLDVSPARLKASGLTLKKAIRAAGRSVRLIPSNALRLSAAQTIHNQLVGPLGWDFILLRHGQRTLLAQTVDVQDISAYSDRDYGRPKRDARVGMLPPKLAQIILNLAINQTEAEMILDPFCGTGVILQEAALMGYGAMGTDIDQRMLDFAKENIEWLQKKGLGGAFRVGFDKGDSTAMTWGSFPKYAYQTIATETYLGRPFSALPSPEVLDEVVRDVDTIIGKFLRNVARQTGSGFRMCAAVPAWQTKNGLRHLPALDSLEKIGYNRLSFKHAGNEDLVYMRPGQIVARELLVLIRT